MGSLSARTPFLRVIAMAMIPLLLNYNLHPMTRLRVNQVQILAILIRMIDIHQDQILADFLTHVAAIMIKWV